MRAAIMTQYGTPDVLKVKAIEKPTPKPGEIVIRVHAAVVGPSDVAFLTGNPFIIKLIYGLRRPKYSVGGTEFAGEVEAVGAGVSRFKPGDRVVGLSPNTFGAHAEYVCVSEKIPMVTFPASIPFQDMVAICDGTATSLIFLRDVAKVKPGQKILINGASGALGLAGVQLAKHYGAHVTGVCSTRNLDLVKSVGADRVIDYTQQDFTRLGDTYDVIYDAVGKRTFGQCKRALTRDGVYLTTVPTLTMLSDVLRTKLFGRKKAKFTTAGLIQNEANLNVLSQLTEAGHIRAVIDRCYPLEQIADAYRYVATERKRGNVVITFS
jgi:NADPH:quinone reductase-like Zn-dependent oxidoreductase